MSRPTRTLKSHPNEKASTLKRVEWAVKSTESGAIKRGDTHPKGHGAVKKK